MIWWILMTAFSLWLAHFTWTAALATHVQWKQWCLCAIATVMTGAMIWMAHTSWRLMMMGPLPWTRWVVGGIAAVAMALWIFRSPE